jgi:hypothetical protein
MISTTSQLRLHHQRPFLPNSENTLIHPIFALVAQFQVEIPQHLGDNETHLMVRQAFTESANNSLFLYTTATYFLPRQSLDPTENGCSAALSSFLKRSSPVQRSGTNDSGSVKFRGLVYIA